MKEVNELKFGLLSVVKKQGDLLFSFYISPTEKGSFSIKGACLCVGSKKRMLHYAVISSGKIDKAKVYTLMFENFDSFKIDEFVFLQISFLNGKNESVMAVYNDFSNMPVVFYVNEALTLASNTCFKDSVLYIYKGNISCIRNRHNIISATAILYDKSDKEIKLNIQRCTTCNRSLLEYDEYKRYRSIYGILVGNLVICSDGDFLSDSEMQEQSPLHLSGYNVSKRAGLSDSARQFILAKIIKKGFMKKQEVIGYLSNFIRVNGNRKGMEESVLKWSCDLTFVEEYNIDLQPEVHITDIRKYEKK